MPDKKKVDAGPTPSIWERIAGGMKKATGTPPTKTQPKKPADEKPPTSVTGIDFTKLRKKWEQFTSIGKKEKK